MEETEQGVQSAAWKSGKLVDEAEALVLQLYRDHRSDFMAFIRARFQLSQEDIQEIFQLSMVTFYENVINRRVQTLDSSVKTYLFAIGKYKAMEWMRRKNKTVYLNSLDHDQELDFEVALEGEFDEDSEKNIAAIGDSLEKLGAPCSEILIAFYYHKVSLSVLAEKLGYKSEGSIKSQKYKCMERLRKIFLKATWVKYGTGNDRTY